jgi:surface antigen
MAKKTSAVAPVRSEPAEIARIENVEPAVSDVVAGVVQSVEIRPDGSKRIQYAAVKSYSKTPDGAVTWTYYRPDNAE